MGEKRCVECVEFKRCRENSRSLIFFIIGLIAIIAVRAVTILDHVNPLYGKLAWYVGILGFFIYFAYKFNVEYKRSRMIKEKGLKDKVFRAEEIGPEDREMIGSVLCALTSNKDRINYFIIFSSSAIVLVIALYLDLFR